MTDELNILARRLKASPDRPVSVSDLAAELSLPEPRIVRNIEDLVKRDSFFDLGNQRIMFTGDSDLAAFEIFRTAALNITYEEFIRYWEQPHLLMRLSRDREVAFKSDPEKMLQNAMKEKQAKGE